MKRNVLVGNGLARLVRFAREPLVHFIVIAAALFGANAVLNPSVSRPTGGDITISEGRIRQIAEGFRLVSGRPPGDEELKALVDDFVTEEIAYREAMAMGLDVDDTVVRRRMRQKLDFLLEDVGAVAEPSEADLNTWMLAHADRYAPPERLAIRQVLASGDRRGESAGRDAAAFIVRLQHGEDPGQMGDPSLLPTALPPTTRAGVAALFGDEFAASVFSDSSEGWFGPVASAFGAHAVLITKRAPPETPILADVREQVRADWIDARRVQLRDEQRTRLRKRYNISIDWPKGAVVSSSANGADPG